MPRLAAGALVIVLGTTACAIQPIEDPGIGAGSLTSTVYAADGTVLTTWHAGQDRVLVSYGELPRHLVDAVVAIEDHRFWVHGGVDPRAVVRAAGANLEAGQIVQGGSTITQQYVKNVLLDGDVTLDRKLSEAGLALQVEATLSKTEILERYLNTIPFARGALGIGAAAKRYFGVDVSELTLAQSALLAGILNNAALYDPYSAPNAALARRRLVLDRMSELGWITVQAAEAAAAEPLGLADLGAGDRSEAPYFVEAVHRRLLQLPALGDTPEERLARLHTGGLTITTTLDPEVQRAADAAVRAVVPADGPAAAVAAIDPRTGYVLAIVGGRDYYDPDDPVAQFDLALQGLRQPGSAFKPFTLAAALEAGIGLEDVFAGGSQMVIDTGGDDPWVVANHENAVFPALSLHEATVFSVNVVYAQVVDLIGPDAVVDLAAAAGIGTPLDPVSSVALGTEEVTVLDMASAYGTFAAGGIHIDPTLVTRIEDAEGTVLYDAVPHMQRAMTAETAESVTAALTDVVRRGTGQHARIGRPVAGKTGTSEGHSDAWFVGYTPELSAAVWVGFPDGSRRLEAPETPYTITGGTWPAQIWARFAATALGGIPYGEAATLSSDRVPVEIDTQTGFVAGPFCPRAYVATVYLEPTALPTVECPIHGAHPAGVIEEGRLPDVIGLPLEDAVALLEMAGQRIEVAWSDPIDLPPGTVVLQAPEGGDGADGSVELVVAGPAPGTVVPDVLGLTESEARQRLASLGMPVLVLRMAESVPADALHRRGLVWAQRPAAATPVDGRVTIWVNPTD